MIKLGPFKGDHTCVYYLKPAEEAKLYDGTYSIIGYNEDGSVITSEAEQIERNVLPSTQWQISAHDATHYGTRLIKKFIPGRDFAYPKSLYAVRDCIRFFVANKPNALIVDFFAGSGTTLHAVNLLNAGAIGKCPIVDDFVPDMLILPDNKMAILNDENQFSDFAEQLAQYPEIEVVYLVTDYESSFVAMTQALEGKKTYQLYRDYLDNFRINAGRNSR